MKELTELRKETSGAIRLLWHSNYWDGPLSGLMLWDNEKAWFEMYEESFEKIPWTQESIDDWVEYLTKSNETHLLDPDDYYDYDYERTRLFKVYRLTQHTLRCLEHDHSLFQKYVGTHCDYDENGKRHHNLAPKIEWSKFYDHKEKFDCSKIEKSEDNVIGFFSY